MVTAQVIPVTALPPVIYVALLLGCSPLLQNYKQCFTLCYSAGISVTLCHTFAGFLLLHCIVYC